MINCNDKDAPGTVGNPIAFPAVWGVPSGDDGGGADVWEAGERAEGLVAFGEESVDAVAAGDDEGGERAVVVGCVVGCGAGAGLGVGCCGKGKDGEDGGEELHFCWGLYEVYKASVVD